MTIDNKIRYEKLQFDINREVAQRPALPSGKTDKHEYLTDEKVLPPDEKKNDETS